MRGRRELFLNRRAFLWRSHAMVARSVAALIDDRKPNSASSAPNTHNRQIECAGRQQQGAAAEQFQDRAGLAALGFGKPRRARDILRAFGDPQRIERAAHAGLFADTPDVLGKPHQRAGLLGAERRLDRAHGLAGPQHRAGGDRLLQHRRIDDFARRAASPLRQPFAEPPDLARILDQLRPARTGAAPPTET